MSKAANIAKISATGSFHILWGLVISTVISSVATIFVARLLGSNLYGLYGIVLVTPNLIGIFRDWGVTSAMVRYTAQFRGEDRENEVRSIFASGLIFEIAMGLALSALSFGLSGFLAANLFHRPSIAPLIELASISILATGLVNAATSAFTGVEKMEHNSVMLIIQSIVKTIIMITLVVEGQGAAGAVTGYTVGYAIAGITGILLMYTIYRKLPKPVTRSLEVKAYTEAMLTYGTPLSFAGMIGSFQGQFYAFLLPIFYLNNNTAIGNYGIASTFVVLITFFAQPITTMLFPAFSKLNPEIDKDALKSVFQFSIKYSSLIVVPVATLVMCLARPAIATLFGTSFSSAALFLALMAVGYVYTAFGSLTTGNFIISQGKTTLALYLTLITAAIGFPVGYLLIMHFGVMGLIVSSLTTGIPSTIISLVWINAHYGLTVDWRSSGKIVTSSITAAALTFVLVSVLPFFSWIRLIIGVVFFVIIFLIVALLTRTVNRGDLDNLKSMTSGLGLPGKIINRTLNLLEKIVTAHVRANNIFKISRRAIFLIALIVIIILVFSFALFGEIFSPANNIIGVKIFGGDIQGNTVVWNTLYIGDSKNASFYVQSTCNAPVVLSILVTAWSPPGIESFLNLSWDYNGSPITPNQTILLTFTLTSPLSEDFAKYLIVNNVTAFSFNLDITSTKY